MKNVRSLRELFLQIAFNLPDSVALNAGSFCRDDIIETCLDSGVLEMYAIEKDFLERIVAPANPKSCCKIDESFSWLYANEMFEIELFDSLPDLNRIIDDSLNRSYIIRLSDFYRKLIKNRVLAVVYTNEIQLPQPDQFSETIIDGSFDGRLLLYHIDSATAICSVPLKFKNSRKIKFPYQKGDYTDFKFQAERAILNDFAKNFRFTAAKLLYFRLGIEPENIRFLLNEYKADEKLTTAI
ncbi:MAG: hypothetical protein KKA07_17760 [Bacteroidetes bacterium]|nr:hypothetical protein [Bacteroidota bacterium]MBU1720918.1 hypothetical protein [Bacteroidota bacterium]